MTRNPPETVHLPNIFRPDGAHKTLYLMAHRMLSPEVKRSICVAYSNSTTNKTYLFLKLFIFVKRSISFGRSLRPSSGAQNCTYGNRHMCSFETPDNGRNDRPKHVERFTKINNWRNRCVLLVVL